MRTAAGPAVRFYPRFLTSRSDEMNGSYSVAEQTKVNITAVSGSGKRPASVCPPAAPMVGRARLTWPVFEEKFNLNASLDMDETVAVLRET